jgi:hypothetical protein
MFVERLRDANTTNMSGYTPSNLCRAPQSHNANTTNMSNRTKQQVCRAPCDVLSTTNMSGHTTSNHGLSSAFTMTQPATSGIATCLLNLIEKEQQFNSNKSVTRACTSRKQWRGTPLCKSCTNAGAHTETNKQQQQQNKKR